MTVTVLGPAATVRLRDAGPAAQSDSEVDAPWQSRYLSTPAAGRGQPPAAAGRVECPLQLSRMEFLLVRALRAPRHTHRFARVPFQLRNLVACGRIPDDHGPVI